MCLFYARSCVVLFTDHLLLFDVSKYLSKYALLHSITFDVSEIDSDDHE